MVINFKKILVQNSCSELKTLVQNSKFLFRIQNSCSEYSELLFRILVQNSWSEFLFRIFVQNSCSEFLWFLILSIRSFILSLMFWQLVIRWVSLCLLSAVLSSNHFIIWPVWLDFNDVAYACPIVLAVARWLVFFNRLFPAMSPGSF